MRLETNRQRRNTLRIQADGGGGLSKHRKEECQEDQDHYRASVAFSEFSHRFLKWIGFRILGIRLANWQFRALISEHGLLVNLN